jgi:hypothetical protein
VLRGSIDEELCGSFVEGKTLRLQCRLGTTVIRRQAQAMAAYGIPEDRIADVLGVAPATLRKHCRKELDTGATMATSQIAEFLYTAILGVAGPNPGDPRVQVVKDERARISAAMFWLKTRGGWKETNVSELTNKDGNPLKVVYLDKDDEKL